MSRLVAKFWPGEAIGLKVEARVGEGEGRSSDVTSSLPSLARLEWDYIQAVMEHFAGNVSKAASALGMHRRSLQRKLRRLPPR
jgi:two-component system response regulator RegA